MQSLHNNKNLLFQHLPFSGTLISMELCIILGPSFKRTFGSILLSHYGPPVAMLFWESSEWA